MLTTVSGKGNTSVRWPLTNTVRLCSEVHSAWRWQAAQWFGNAACLKHFMTLLKAEEFCQWEDWMMFYEKDDSRVAVCFADASVDVELNNDVLGWWWDVWITVSVIREMPYCKFGIYNMTLAFTCCFMPLTISLQMGCCLITDDYRKRVAEHVRKWVFRPVGDVSIGYISVLLMPRLGI